MGQLERYGLYVLCVVIVLILGVAIWGGDPASSADLAKVKELDQALESAGEEVTPSTVLGRESGDIGSGFFLPEPIGERKFALAPVENQLKGVASVDDPPAGSPESALNNPTSPPKPGTHALRTYKVRPDDTMEKIASKVLRDKRLVKRIQELNPGVNPRKMPIGTVLKLPAAEEAMRPAPVSNAEEAWREYKVVKGDSAYKISKKMYGNSKHADKILKANGISDPKKLRPKTVLKIPPLQ